ncbi:MAG TPA: hypothetical protein VLY65_01115, partial [Nitrososphaerales archaeon]|nr:hypothetical protein [Nitrososphaerales archaeon]
MTTLRAKASTFGAISLVNAIASGKGATASVRLLTEAEVSLEESAGPFEATVNGERTDSPLASETVARAI